MTRSQWASSNPKSGSAVMAVELGALWRSHQVVMSPQVPEASGMGLCQLPQVAGSGHPSQESRAPEGIFGSPSGCIGSCGSHRRVGEDTSSKFLLGLLKTGTCATVQGVDPF